MHLKFTNGIPYHVTLTCKCKFLYIYCNAPPPEIAREQVCQKTTAWQYSLVSVYTSTLQ